MTIKVFKLISGEEVIAEVTTDNAEDAFITIDHPTTIMMQQTERGVGVALVPYMPYAEKQIQLFKTAIASMSEPLVEMRNEYTRVTGTGIQVVSQGIQV